MRSRQGVGSQTRNEGGASTTAKIVLVGDSGVGKTGLGWRLAHGEFKEHSSTHGQQFWVLSELGTAPRRTAQNAKRFSGTWRANQITA